ncbi:unnamed protein product [Brachionus calyciflorus]|uniref:Uncharacterized protein n=1 Tax=Brachionus calyciflorus TaxID=104777 RepID=A0A814MXB4_9BILA|nr:unnamed protein product [Brachionus calyciflorus]
MCELSHNFKSPIIEDTQQTLKEIYETTNICCDNLLFSNDNSEISSTDDNDATLNSINDENLEGIQIVRLLFKIKKELISKHYETKSDDLLGLIIDFKSEIEKINTNLDSIEKINKTYMKNKKFHLVPKVNFNLTNEIFVPGDIYQIFKYLYKTPSQKSPIHADDVNKSSLKIQTVPK